MKWQGNDMKRVKKMQLMGTKMIKRQKTVKGKKKKKRIGRQKNVERME